VEAPIALLGHSVVVTYLDLFFITTSSLRVEIEHREMIALEEEWGCELS
jgi:hypothetical protein